MAMREFNIEIVGISCSVTYDYDVATPDSPGPPHANGEPREYVIKIIGVYEKILRFSLGAPLELPEWLRSAIMSRLYGDPGVEFIVHEDMKRRHALDVLERGPRSQ